MIPIHGPAADKTVADAALRPWPVIVVGAGIAGASMAFALASRGVRVLLLDRAAFPRAKTCGGCLNPRAVSSLERLGLGEVVHALNPNPLQGVEWRTPRGRKAFLNFPGGFRPRACAVSRTRLDIALIDAAVASGAEFLPGVRVLGSRIDGEHRLLRVRTRSNTGIDFHASIVVACDGLGSALAKEAGLARAQTTKNRTARIGTSTILPPHAIINAPNDRILMACAREGYAGAVRVESGQWDIAAAIRLRSALSKDAGLAPGSSPSDIAIRILRECGVGFDGDAFRDTTWTVTPPHLLRRVVRPWAGRLLLVGDASGYVEPITGEGMAWALAAVEAAAPILEQGWSDNTGMRWETAWRTCVARRTRTVRIATAIVSSPLATESIVAAMGAIPAAGRLFAAPLFRDAVRTGTGR